MVRSVFLLAVLCILFPAIASAFMQDEEVAALQRQMADEPVGGRIAFWAEKFLNTPYDPDPLGEYVRRNVIVADERVDCMYLTFRAVELALGKDPGDAVRVALDKRFITLGKAVDGKVLNYEERFQYGEDMIDSGKWGAEITSRIGRTSVLPGIRGRETVAYLPADSINKGLALFRTGDIVFFVNHPDRMPVAGIIGHMAIIKVEKDGVYLIHASGRKNIGGKVIKVLLPDYVQTMPFAGIRVSRFEADNPCPGARCR